MSAITATFNAAAAGPTGESGAVSGGSEPSTPGGSGVAPTENSINYISTSHEAAPSWFNTSGGSRHDTTSNGYASDQKHNSGVDAAKAELEILKRATLKPSQQLNLNPPQYVKKPADLKAERERLARGNALRAYMEFHVKDLADEADHNQGNDLELCI